MIKSAPKTEVIEVTNEGPVELLDKKVIVFCSTYFYTGKLIGINDKYIKLENPAIVYETGNFKDAKWKDEQPLGVPFLLLFMTSFEGMALSK